MNIAERVNVGGIDVRNRAQFSDLQRVLIIKK